MQGLRVKFDEKSISDLRNNFDKLIKELEDKSKINISFNQDAFKNIDTEIDKINKKLTQLGNNTNLNIKPNVDLEGLNKKLSDEETIIRDFAKKTGLNYSKDLKDAILNGVGDLSSVLEQVQKTSLDKSNKNLKAEFNEMMANLNRLKEQTLNTKGTSTQKKVITIDNASDNTILQQLQQAKAKIESETNSIAKLDVYTNGKDKIQSATISYTDNIGKVIEENYKLMTSIKETDNTIVKTLDFEKVGSKYSDDISKSMRDLSSLEKQLNRLNGNNLKIDNVNHEDFNKVYASTLNEINTLKQKGQSISTQEKQDIINKLKLMNQENERLSEITKTEKTRERVLREEQKIRRAISKSQQAEINNKQNANYSMAKAELNKIKKYKSDILKLDDKDSNVGKTLNQYLTEHQHNLSEILKSKVQVGDLDEENAVNSEQFLKLQNQIKENYKKIKLLKMEKIDTSNRTTSTTSSGRMHLGEEVKIKTPFNFNASKKELDAYAKSVVGTRAEWTKCVPKVDNLKNEMKEVSVRTKEGSKYWHNYSMILDKSTGKIYKVDKGLSDLQNRQLGLAEKMKIATSSFFVWMNVTNMFYQGLHKLKEGIEFTKDLNKMQTNIQMITGMDRSKIQSVTSDFQNLAGTLHSTTKEVMAGAEEFLRAGKSIDETRNLLKSATVGGKISGQDTSAVAEQLIAISNGFKINVADGKQVMGIVDKLSTVDNNASTSFRELATAMQYTSSTAQAVNVEMPNLISYIGTISSVSRKSAESIGNSMKTIFTRFQSVKEGKQFDPDNEPLSNVEKSLNRVGIAIRKDKTHFKDFNTVLEEIGIKWKTFNDIEKNTITSALGGTRQRENLEILLNNMEQVHKLQEKMNTATGSAEQKFDRAYGKSIEAKINELKLATEKLYQAFINSDAINAFVDGVRHIVEGLTFLITSCKGSKIALLGLASSFVIVLKNFRHLQTANWAGIISLFSGLGSSAKNLGIALQSANLSGMMSLFSGSIKGITASVMHFVTSPLTLLITTLGLASVAVIKHIRHQKQLKDDTEKLTGSYKNLTEAMKENNVEMIKAESKNVAKKEKELIKLIKQRNKLQDKLKKSSDNGVNNLYTGNGVEYNKLGQTNQQIKELTQVLKESGFTIDENTGKILELNEAKTKLGNNEIVEKLEKEKDMALKHKDEIAALMQEYQKLNAQENKDSSTKERMSQISKQLASEVSELIVVTDKDNNSTIKNTEVLNTKIKMINKEKDAIVTKYKIMRDNSKEEAKIQIGSTQLTYAEVKKRIQAIKDEIKSLKLLEEAKKKANFQSQNNDDDSKTASLILRNKKFKENQVSELEDLVKQVDALYDKPIGASNTSTDSYMPPSETDKATNSTKSNTEANKQNSEAVNQAKESVKAYENAMKSLEMQMTKINIELSHYNEHSDAYINKLKEKKKLIQDEINLNKQQIGINNQLANSLGGGTAKYTTNVASTLGQDVVNKASKFLGTPYVWGGTNPNGFDCSGLIQYVYNQVGKQLSRTTYTQIKEGTHVDKNNLQQGDLVFFGTSKDPHHVGMYAGNGNYIHAPKRGDVVKVSSLASRGDYLEGRRIINSSSSTNNHSVVTEEMDLIGKATDIEKKNLELQEELHKINIDILNSKIGQFEDKTKVIDRDTTQLKANAEIQSKNDINYINYLSKIDDYTSKKLDVLKQEREYISKEIKSGIYDEKTVKMLTDKYSDLGTELLNATKAFKDATLELASARYEAIQKIYNDNIEMLNAELDRLSTEETKNLTSIIGLRQQVISQDELNIKRLTDLIKQLNEESYKQHKPYLFEKMEEYAKELNKANTDLVKHKKELENVKDTFNSLIESTEDKVKQAIQKINEEYKKNLEKRRKLFDDAVDKQVEKIEEAKRKLDKNETAQNDYEKIIEIQEKINRLDLNDSIEAKKQRHELEKELKNAQRDQRSHELNYEIDERKKRLTNAKEEYNKLSTRYDSKLSESFEDDKLTLEARQALMNGYIVDLNGNIIDLEHALVRLEDMTGKGLSSTGNKIKKEIIENLHVVRNIIKEFGTLDTTKINFQQKPIINVYGTGIDIENAKKMLGVQGYNYVDTKMVDASKIKLNNNDLVLGEKGSMNGLNRDDLGGATRLGGSNRYETASIIQLYKDVQDGKLAPINGVVYGSGQDLENSMKWLAPLGYKFVDTSKIKLNTIKFNQNDLIVGGIGAKGGVPFDVSGVQRLGGRNRFDTDKQIQNFATSQLETKINETYRASSIKNGTVYGTGVDLLNAKKHLKRQGYNFIDTKDVTDRKLNTNDIIVGGGVRGAENIYNSGAKWLKGANRYETESLINEFARYNNIKGFSSGGIIDYTGLAMVHGGNNPEMVLNNQQAAKLHNFIKSLPQSMYIPNVKGFTTSNIRNINTKNTEGNKTYNQYDIKLIVEGNLQGNERDANMFANKIVDIMQRK